MSKGDMDRYEEQWLADRLARLAPPQDWQPDTYRALETLEQRHQTPASRRWSRALMAVAVFAAAGSVVAALPWRALWEGASIQRDPAAAGAANSHTAQGSARQPTFTATSPATTLAASQPPAPGTPAQATTAEVFVRRNAVVEAEAAGAAAAEPAPQQGNLIYPSIIYKVDPSYTPEAKEARLQGSVEVTCLVLKDGTVTDIKVTRSLGYGLDENAVAAVQKWRFEPGRKDGAAIDLTISILLHFTLR